MKKKTKSNKTQIGPLRGLICVFDYKNRGKQMTRSESREQAFILNFEAQFSDRDIDEIIDLAGEMREFKISAFAGNLIHFTQEHRAEINTIIETHTKRWGMKRISKVSLSVLQLAIGEIMQFDDIPVSVTINEAVELCKKYGGDEDFSFVNGILGSYVKTVNRNGGKDE